MSPDAKFIVSSFLFILFSAVCYILARVKLSNRGRNVGVKDVDILLGTFLVIAGFDWLGFYHSNIYVGVCVLVSIGMVYAVFFSDGRREAHWGEIIGTFLAFTLICPIMTPLILCFEFLGLVKKDG